MRGITVCVEYEDLLSITLPYNRHHFTEFMVVTNLEPHPTLIELCKNQDCQIHYTDAFYRNGAIFNKWLALEEGLDKFGRQGLMCLMDADVLWPHYVPQGIYKLGVLYTPYRRIANLKNPTEEDVQHVLSGEWDQYPFFKENEFAGYTQIFHAHDPVLQDCEYWHETDWSHAGGADSFFQNKWDSRHKYRPSWSVLHLGLPGVNWCGRTSINWPTGTDLQLPSHTVYQRKQQLERIAKQRTINGDYTYEKLTAKPS